MDHPGLGRSGDGCLTPDARASSWDERLRLVTCQWQVALGRNVRPQLRKGLSAVLWRGWKGLKLIVSARSIRIGVLG